MGALSLALPVTYFLYLVPLLYAHDLGRVAEQLNNLIDIIDIPKEIHGDNGEIEFEFLDPPAVSKPVVTVRDPSKLNVGFQAKVESRGNNLPLSPVRGGISANVQLANQAKWSQGALSSENEASKEFSSDEEWIDSARETRRAAATEGTRKNATVHLTYIPDIKDILREKFAKTSMQLGLDVGVTSKDTDENVDRIDAGIVDNRSKGRKNYIRLCKRLTGGSTTSLMQKLRGKDCVKLPRSEFYLEPSARSANGKRDDAVRLVGLRIETKTGKDRKNSGDENKQRGGVADVAEASISDVPANYDESSMKVADKFGTGLNFRMIDGRIANLLRDGKLSLSASTALKV
ncbi:PREDICTED: uncharacterized protein LOC105565716 [Vollenhovia emeryi]|uniref:uncharacterized protein LOC105565716 n=1 Tax=Vollenhovia emeryi TaxID=411798 RepID=UPI0005F48736|nr:PREDICTED: uncharacterized protein LOC105565716 [Vollenhovia emeryi]